MRNTEGIGFLIKRETKRIIARAVQIEIHVGASGAQMLVYQAEDLKYVYSHTNPVNPGTARIHLFRGSPELALFKLICRTVTAGSLIELFLERGVKNRYCRILQWHDSGQDNVSQWLYDLVKLAVRNPKGLTISEDDVVLVQQPYHTYFERLSNPLITRAVVIQWETPPDARLVQHPKRLGKPCISLGGAYASSIYRRVYPKDQK